MAAATAADDGSCGPTVGGCVCCAGGGAGAGGGGGPADAWTAADEDELVSSFLD